MWLIREINVALPCWNFYMYSRCVIEEKYTFMKVFSTKLMLTPPQSGDQQNVQFWTLLQAPIRLHISDSRNLNSCVTNSYKMFLYGYKILHRMFHRPQLHFPTVSILNLTDIHLAGTVCGCNCMISISWELCCPIREPHFEKPWVKM
jgi:hypothetical protein